MKTLCSTPFNRLTTKLLWVLVAFWLPTSAVFGYINIEETNRYRISVGFKYNFQNTQFNTLVGETLLPVEVTGGLRMQSLPEPVATPDDDADADDADADDPDEEEEEDNRPSFKSKDISSDYLSGFFRFEILVPKYNASVGLEFVFNDDETTLPLAAYDALDTPFTYDLIPEVPAVADDPDTDADESEDAIPAYNGSDPDTDRLRDILLYSVQIDKSYELLATFKFDHEGSNLSLYFKLGLVLAEAKETGYVAIALGEGGTLPTGGVGTITEETSIDFTTTNSETGVEKIDDNNLTNDKTPLDEVYKVKDAEIEETSSLTGFKFVLGLELNLANLAKETSMLNSSRISVRFFAEYYQTNYESLGNQTSSNFSVQTDDIKQEGISVGLGIRF